MEEGVLRVGTQASRAPSVRMPAPSIVMTVELSLCAFGNQGFAEGKLHQQSHLGLRGKTTWNLIYTTAAVKSIHCVYINHAFDSREIL